MADEMTQEQTSESASGTAPVASDASVEGNSQQVQNDQTTASASETQPEAASTETEELAEWNGNNVEELPKPLQSRARAMLRHLHRVSQEAAAVKHQAQAYNELVNNPEFKEFSQWKQTRFQNPSPVQPVEQLSEDDFLAAQTDPNKFVEVQSKLLMQQAQPFLQRMQALEQRLSKYDAERAKGQARQELDSFAEVHPDFWDINPVIMKATLEEVVNQGGSIDEAYNKAKSIEKQYLDKAHSTIKQKVEEKKKAVTAAPSKSMEPEIIYVANRREAARIAGENALLGKRVDVRVKK